MIRPTGEGRGAGRVFGSKLHRASIGRLRCGPQDQVFLIGIIGIPELTSARAGLRQPAELREASPSR
jgi:hypothetical protein